MRIDEERAAAEKNIERLTANIPTRLSEKEDKFSTQLIRAKKSPRKKLESLYSFMDELYEFVSKYTPCKKGCTNCCHYAVTVSDVEIEHIERFTKKKRNRQPLPKKDFHGSPCPFLKQGACSIYNARPFVCRRHVTLTETNAWCDPSISNDETFPLLKFTSIEEAFEHIRIESNSIELSDIRQIFS